MKENTARILGILFLFIAAMVSVTLYALAKDRGLDEILPLPLGLSFIFVFFAGSSISSFSKKYRAHRLAGAMIACGLSVGVYHLALFHWTNSPLSQLLATGSRCTYFIRAVPIRPLQNVGQNWENTCYARAFRDRLFETHPRERIHFLKEALSTFKTEGRLNPDSVQSLLSSTLRAHTEEEKIPFTHEIHTTAAMNSFDDVLTILESLPVQDEFRELVSKNLENKFYGIALNSVPSRMPASAELISKSERLNTLIQRYKSIQKKWQTL